MVNVEVLPLEFNLALLGGAAAFLVHDVVTFDYAALVYLAKTFSGDFLAGKLDTTGIALSSQDHSCIHVLVSYVYLKSTTDGIMFLQACLLLSVPCTHPTILLLPSCARMFRVAPSARVFLHHLGRLLGSCVWKFDRRNQRWGQQWRRR